jgi:hypothetical protein
MAKPKVLAAFPPPSLEVVSQVIGEDVELVFTNALSSARALLAATPDFAMVLCGVYFDESRMYDLLEHVQRDFRHLPFVVVRIVEREGRPVSMAALGAAAQAAGAAGVFDFVAISQSLGKAAAERALREAILRHLPRREGAS